MFVSKKKYEDSLRRTERWKKEYLDLKGDLKKYNIYVSSITCTGYNPMTGMGAREVAFKKIHDDLIMLKHIKNGIVDIKGNLTKKGKSMIKNLSEKEFLTKIMEGVELYEDGSTNQVLPSIM